MSESAWEPYGRDHAYVCDFITEDGYCNAPATWHRPGLPDGPFVDDAYDEWADRFDVPHACDEHKAEPQPPTYSEWLAVQA